MKRADEAVEKVLAGLRGVEAGAGFQERMERRVREAARGRRGGRFAAWQWAGVCGVAMVLAGLGLSVLRIEKQAVVATNAGSTHGGGVQAGQDEIGAVEEGVSQRLKPHSTTQLRGTAEALPLSEANSLSGVSPSRKSSLYGSSLEFVRGAEKGFPAPPLPLTEQERLLLRVARHGEPVPIVALELATVPSQDAADTAEFQGFFGKPEQIEQINQKVNQGESR